MAIWSAKLTSFSLEPTFTAQLELNDLGNGNASGTISALSGPVKADAIALNGVVNGNTFVVGGSVQALGINLYVSFCPYVFGYVGSAHLLIHATNEPLDLYVITEQAS